MPNSLFLSSTIPTEVSAITSSLKDNKASGPDSIPIKLLKMFNPHISVSLSILINQLFESGIFPDKFKIAQIIPIFKKDDSSLVMASTGSLYFVETQEILSLVAIAISEKATDFP